MSLTISSSLTAGIFWLAYFASLARSDLSDISTIKYNHTGTPFDIDGNTRGYMDDLKMDKKFFFNWGKTRINLTEYLIQHNRNNSHWSNVISIDEPEDKEVGVLFFFFRYRLHCGSWLSSLLFCCWRLRL